MPKYTSVGDWARENLLLNQFCVSHEEEAIFFRRGAKVEKLTSAKYKEQAAYWTQPYTSWELVTPPADLANSKGNDMTLYTWTLDDTNFYGTQLAINSSGQWVMEIKGTGNVVAIDPAIIEEVIPHTVDVQFLGNNAHNYSYWAPAGKYAVNDLLLLNAPSGLALAIVTKVDTKSKKANKDLPVIGKIALDTAIAN